MTREETKNIIRIMVDGYPHYKPNNISETIDTWWEMLKDFPYRHVAIGLKNYMLSDTSGFAPSIGQIIEKIQAISVPSELNEMEAWALVSRALRNGYYGAEQEFEKLPPLVQKAVGHPSQLRQWSQTDIDSIENVIQSNFMRTYRAVCKREREIQILPAEIKALIEKNRTRLNIETKQTNLIELKEERNEVVAPLDIQERLLDRLNQTE